MNERIGKLAVEAGAYWDHGDWNMPSSVYFSERDLEKFAELIVRQCALTAGLMEQQGRTGIGAQLLDNFEIKD
jgi:hypothetical protein